MSSNTDDKKPAGGDGGDLDAVTARINSLMAKTPAAGGEDKKKADEEAAVAAKDGGEKKQGSEEEKKEAPASTAAASDAKPAADAAPAAGPSSPTQAKDKDGNLLESKYDVTVTLADQQADPNSPLYSVKSFDQLGLSEELLKGIYSMKYQKPSKIQERALPLLLQNPCVYARVTATS